jgi:hypothetical protein
VDSYVDGAARKAAARAQVAAAQAKVGSNAGVLACVRLGRALEGGPRHSLCDRVMRCAHALLPFCPHPPALLSYCPRTPALLSFCPRSPALLTSCPRWQRSSSPRRVAR